MVEFLNNKVKVNIVNKKKQIFFYIVVGVISLECIKILLKVNVDLLMKVFVFNINFIDIIIYDVKILDCFNDKKYYKFIVF